MPEQLVTIPLARFNNLERTLNKVLALLEDKKPRWLDAREFGAETGKTKEQLRYLRETHPELVKPKPQSSTQYLYDMNGYEKMRNAAR